MHSKHFAWLFGVDMVVIDEISMLTATALAGVASAFNFVASRGASTPRARAPSGPSVASLRSALEHLECSWQPHSHPGPGS